MEGKDDNEQIENMAVTELKKRMKGDLESEMYEDDNLFRRFLKARDFNVDNAETMLRNHLEWRKKNDVKNIRKKEFPEVIKKYFRLVHLGYDKDGCILKYNHFGNTDFRGIYESCTQEEWLSFLIYYFEEDVEEFKRQSIKLSKTVDKITYIENMEHFSLSKATDRKVISNIVVTINMYLDNYPETMKSIYVINAPVYFNIFFSLIKTFLPSTVLRKIKIYSDDSWKKDLLDQIDADVLPAFLGGNRTDPDGNPLCLSLNYTPEPVPKSYYLSKSKRSFPTLLDAEKLSIPRASNREVAVDVTEPNSYLEWEFELKSGDIKFGLIHTDEEGRKTELIPSHKVNTDDSVESGLYKCDRTGRYTVVFDNNFSLLKTKEIFYRIKVRSSQEQVPP